MSTSPITLKLMVDKSINQVVFAESNKDFMDILLSFLTLPLGTIIKLYEKQSSIGCMDKLYKSVENLDMECLNTKECKNMLLNPRNSSADMCKKLRINIDTTTIRYFVSSARCCRELSTYPNCRCRCGKVMDKELSMISIGVAVVDHSAGVFVNGPTRFVISEDLVIVPSSTAETLSLLGRLRIEDNSTLEETVVRVERKDILHLLKCSFLSKTPLTDVFLPNLNKNIPTELKPSDHIHRTQILPDTMSKSKMMISLKLILKKKDKKLLYAESNQEFVEVLFSFLTSPVGSIMEQLGEQSHIGCIDNIYKSVTCLSSSNCLKNGECIEMLLNPKLAQYSCYKYLLKSGEESEKRYYMCNKSNCNYYSNYLSKAQYDTCGCKSTMNRQLSVIDPEVKNSSYIFMTSDRFLVNAMYMVTDDLVVTPLSTISVISHLKSASVSKEEIEEMIVQIGENEVLELMQNSLTSKTALTDAFMSKRGWSGKKLRLLDGAASSNK